MCESEGGHKGKGFSDISQPRPSPPRHFLVLSYNQVRLSAFQFVSSSLLDAFRKRLLVPGAITLDIIEVYILTIKVHELGAATSAHPYLDVW